MTKADEEDPTALDDEIALMEYEANHPNVEPIEGCTEEDAGWMRVEHQSAMVAFYNLLSDVTSGINRTGAYQKLRRPRGNFHHRIHPDREPVHLPTFDKDEIQFWILGEGDTTYSVFGASKKGLNESISAGQNINKAHYLRIVPGDTAICTGKKRITVLRPHSNTYRRACRGDIPGITHRQWV